MISFRSILWLSIICLISVLAWANLPIELKPIDEYATIAINISADGYSPELIETELTAPIESIISTIQGIRGVSSRSTTGNASITFTLEKETNLLITRLTIDDALRHFKLPPNTFLSIDEQSNNEDEQERSQAILTVRFLGKESPAEIHERLLKDLVPKIKALPEIMRANLSGESEREWYIELKPRITERTGITVQEIQQAINNSTQKFNLGKITVNAYEHFLSVENDQIEYDFFAQTHVKHDTLSYALLQLATVEYRYKPSETVARLNGQSSLTLNIYRKQSTNVLESIDKVKKILKEALPLGISSEIIDDQSIFIKNEFSSLFSRSIWSLACVVLVLIIFSRNLYEPLALFISIIISLAVIGIAFYLFSLTINFITLAALALSFGMMVDNSIVYMEHIKAHPEHTIKEATRAIAPAIFASTLTAIIVFLPFIWLTDKLKAEYIPFAIAMAFAQLISMMITFTVMPSLTGIWYKAGLKEKESRLTKLITPTIQNSLRFPKTIVLFFILIFGLPIYAVPDSLWQEIPYVKEIRPELETYLGGISHYFLENAKFNEYNSWNAKPTVYISLELPFGSTFEQTDHLVKFFETGLLLQYPKIQLISNIYKTSAYIQISFPDAKNFIGLEVKSRAMAMASDLGDIDISVSGIDQNYYHNSASSADFSNNNFKITGYNYSSLKKYGEHIGQILTENPRVRAIKIKSNRWGQEKKKHFNFLIDANKLISNGFSLDRFLNALQSKVATIAEGSTFTNKKRTSIVYSGESKLQDLDIILLQDYQEKNKSVRMSEFVKTSLATESDEIIRENQSYQLYVTFDYLGPYEFAAKFKKKILPTIAVPMGFTLSEDSYRYREEDKKAMLWVMILAVFLVFLVTASAYESFKISLLILLSIPMSLIGIFLFYAESGMNFTMATKIGIILVCGLTVNSAMLLVSEVQEQSKKGLDLVSSIVKGLGNVFRPMLMTTCVLVLGLLPMLFHPEKLGEDIWATLSYTAIGGLIASFVLVTLVFPSLILLFYRKKGSL